MPLTRDKPFTHSLLGPLSKTTLHILHKPRVSNWQFIFIGSSWVRPKPPEITQQKKPPNSKNQLKAWLTPVRLYPWKTQDLSSLVAQHKAATPCPTAQMGSRKELKHICEHLQIVKTGECGETHAALLQWSYTALTKFFQAVGAFLHTAVAIIVYNKNYYNYYIIITVRGRIRQLLTPSPETGPQMLKCGAHPKSWLTAALMMILVHSTLGSEPWILLIWTEPFLYHCKAANPSSETNSEKLLALLFKILQGSLFPI